MLKRAIVAMIAVALLALLVFACFLRDYANAIDNVHWVGSPLPPCFVDAAKCGGHWLGTDEVGRDLLARLIVATPVSLGMSLGAAALELGLIGCFLLLGQRVGGAARLAIARVAGGISCFCAWPLIVVIALVTFDLEFRSSIRLGFLALIAGVLVTTRSTPEFIGERKPWSHTTGRVMRDWAAIMLMLATVDFFGWGVQPPVPSWGNMLVTFQSNIQIAWWAAVFPALCIFVAASIMEIGGRALAAPRPPMARADRQASRPAWRISA